MNDARRDELAAIAIDVRKDVVRMVGVSRTRGLASALTIVDLLVYLYWECLRVYPDDRNRPDRDRLVMSKGAAAPALYACLAKLGFFHREELWSYRRLGAMLQGYPDIRTPGIDAPCGVHGGGIGIASGLALAQRMDGIAARVFCILGAGELREGVVWESLYAAAADALGRLVVIIDAGELADCGDLTGKLTAFGCAVFEADGHDFDSLQAIFGGLDFSDPRPKAVVTRMNRSRIASLLIQDDDVAKPMSNDEMDDALSRLEQESQSRGNGNV